MEPHCQGTSRGALPTTSMESHCQGTSRGALPTASMEPHCQGTSRGALATASMEPHGKGTSRGALPTARMEPHCQGTSRGALPTASMEPHCFSVIVKESLEIKSEKEEADTEKHLTPIKSETASIPVKGFPVIVQESFEIKPEKEESNPDDRLTTIKSKIVSFTDDGLPVVVQEALPIKSEKAEPSTEEHLTTVKSEIVSFTVDGGCKHVKPRSKEISEDLRKAVIDAHQSRKGYKTISKALGLPQSTVRQIVYKWRKFKTTVNLPRSGRPTKISPRTNQQIIQEVTKNPRVTSKDLQATLALANVSVHDSTIRKRLNNGGWIARRKPLLSKKNIAARLKFAKEHIDDPQDFWNNVLWTDESKVELFGLNEKRSAWRKPNTVFEQKNLIPTVKHGDGSVMVWGCFAASGPGRLAIIDTTMNSALYQKILEENVGPSVCELKLNQKWVMQQENDPKHTSRSTKEWLLKNKFCVLEWPSQSPDLNPIEMLWQDLKRAVHARKPSNVTELKQFCKEEWAKIPQDRCERLTSSYRKRLVEVIAAHGGATRY
ncbi:uncharacterized protein LOC142488342 isoform X3 [Ascaphus truei]|uniref:uncharacterized protein LOC142488342 isoform X3 n=1 Tax=Ascaphus truei TaxID=8439 RepID=UPI003F5A5CF3